MITTSIFEYALQKEKEGAALYRSLAQRSTSASFKLFFNWLAEEEDRHYAIIEKLQRNTADIIHSFSSQLEFSHTFLQIVDSIEAAFPIDNEIDLLKEALKQEANSYLFYKRQARQTDDQIASDIFHKISLEELNHEKALSRLINYFKKQKREKEFEALNEIED